MPSDHCRTSVWIDHLKNSDAVMADLLETGRVLAHSLVTGELALGSLRRRRAVLEAPRDLPQGTIASDHEFNNAQ